MSNSLNDFEKENWQGFISWLYNLVTSLLEVRGNGRKVVVWINGMGESCRRKSTMRHPSVDSQASSQGGSAEKEVFSRNNTEEKKYPCETQSKVSSLPCFSYRNKLKINHGTVQTIIVLKEHIYESLRSWDSQR